MKSYKTLYPKIYSLGNLFLAYQKARKGKTKKNYVKEFEENLFENIKKLQLELKLQIYSPKPIKTFIIRDPKTRKISKSSFRDRIIHHALCNLIEPIFEKTFIYDSCANRKNKGTLFAIRRFESFQRKITKNLSSKAYCLKADIKHYFQEVNREVLLNIIRRKIKCQETIRLIELILNNFDRIKGMPLGNLTSQFFANVYLHELDYFVKHKLKVKYYIRYVDDFVILHKSKEQLIKCKEDIQEFLKENLKLELHPDKSRIVNLSKGVDFVGLRNFYHYRLLRKRNRKIAKKRFKDIIIKNSLKEKKIEKFQGWNAYAKWANTFYLRKNILKKLNKPNQN